jgi:aquaporin Z
VLVLREDELRLDQLGRDRSARSARYRQGAFHERPADLPYGTCMQNHSRILGAETLGTAVLMLGGPGSAILAGDRIGVLGVSLAFGFSLLIMAYVIGPVSGCHINPAVTLGLLVAKKVDGKHAAMAWIGQVIGAALGGGIILAITSGLNGFERGRFAANGWAELSPGGFGWGSAVIVEVVFTALLVLVVLATTGTKFAPAMGGLTVGITLALIHLVTIPVDNTSVNPARSFGTAIFADSSTDALEQLWVFILFPLVGALLAVLLWLMIDDTKLEATGLFVPPLAQARDIADHVVEGAVGAVDHVVEKAGQVDDDQR